MNDQKCPACGAALAEDVNICNCCGMEGLNQLFLEKEAYNVWVHRVLVPHIFLKAKKRLNERADGSLLLLGNGDLFAFGNNLSGRFGIEQPDKLAEPVRIAEGIRSAALGDYHTVLVYRDGRAEVLGNSSMSDRFACGFSAINVYAHPKKELFLLEDADGMYYFLGDNSSAFIPRMERILLIVPPQVIKEEKHYNLLEVRHPYPWTSGEDVYQYLASVYRREDEEYSADESIQNSGWFKELLREYGEPNIRVEKVKKYEAIEIQDVHNLLGCYSSDNNKKYEILEGIDADHCLHVNTYTWANYGKRWYYDKEDREPTYRYPYEGRHGRSYQMGSLEYSAVKSCRYISITQNIILENQMIYKPVYCESGSQLREQENFITCN
ncbi:MAG: hypothetical protein IKY96_07575 [Oscillospiraceae bacterium]|nr:hypothetical protein [Oscillospiraceae bacterium]